MKIVFIVLLHIFLRSFGKQFRVCVCVCVSIYNSESFNLVGSMPKCFGSWPINICDQKHTG
jgi:hypothetical protein